MDLNQITEIFKWMTIINFALFLFSALLTISIKDFVARMHGRFYGISEEKVMEAIYGYFGTYKIAIILFNLVPYIALLIVG